MLLAVDGCKVEGRSWCAVGIFNEQGVLLIIVYFSGKLG